MKKRILALVLCIFLVGSLFVGCGSPKSQAVVDEDTVATASEEKTDSTESSAAETQAASQVDEMKGEVYFLSNQSNWVKEFYPQMIKDFNAKYPNIKLTTDGIDGYEETLKIRMSSDDLPDVFVSNQNVPSAEQRQQYLMPLDDLPVAPDIDDAFKSFFKGDDGKTYAIPYAKDLSGVVIYNKKIFEELSISIPKTLDELIAAGKKIKEKGYFAGLALSSKAQWTMCQFDEGMPRFYSGDPNVFNTLDVNSDTPFTLDGPWGKTFQLIDTLVKSGIVNDSPNSYDWDPLKADFAAGNVGMYFMASWFVPQGVPKFIDKENKEGEIVGIFPMPFDNSGKLYAKYAPMPGISISAKTKNADASKAFVNFLLSDYNEKLCREQAGFSTNKNVNIVYDWSTDFVAEQMVEAPKNNAINNIWTTGQVDFSAKASAVAGGSMTPEKAIEALNKCWATGRKATKK
jgi:raffinose/stachyose/melibiose transport system substrate-binding protein